MLEDRLRCVAVALALAGAAGCTGKVGNADGSSESGGGPGGVVLPDGTKAAALLPARIRRLTNAEYDASVKALIGTSSAPGEGLAPDARQDGYTVNEAQRIDPVLGKQLAAAAEALAAEVKSKLTELAPCADPAGQAEQCATAFIESFAGKAYRRPLEQADIDPLLTVYRVGAKGASYADGIELVARAVLQSPGFLYVTEIGEGSGAGSGSVALTPYELASGIAYLVTGGPPDQALLDAAKAGKLVTPEGREIEARRLLATPGAEARLVRIVREWLGVDRIAVTAKDSNAFPKFAELRPSMERETADFVSEVLSSSNGDVSELLGADWTVADAALASSLYGASGEGRVSLTGRRGLLNQGAFLAVNAHASETAPVLRGVTVMRRVACIDVPSPTTLNINVVPPVPDPAKTTRERFSIHSQDAQCKACHASIDAFGFSFEGFDGMGMSRSTENGKPIDSAVTVKVDADFDGDYPDSSALAKALSSSASVRSCLARQVFRATAAQSGPAVVGSEKTFMEVWGALPAEDQGSIVEMLVAYVKSTLFSHRRAQ